MNVKLLAFAQAADALGFREREIECGPHDSVRSILAQIAPGFDVTTLRAAADQEYIALDAEIGEVKELALIPPVSGG